MIRTHLLEELTRVLGQPRDARDYTEWLVESPDDARRMRVCLNRRFQFKDTAHVMVFDPLQPKGDSVLELSAGTMAEADAIIQRIKGIKSSHDSHASQP